MDAEMTRTQPLEPDERLEREAALEQLKKRRDFMGHLFIYAVVNVTVWAVWLVIGLTSGSWWPWPVFVTLGWGIGVAANAWDVYARRPISEEDIRREMQRMRTHVR